MSTVIKTMCPMNCHPTYCGMEVEVEDDRVLSIRGDKDNPASHGFLCIRGRATIEIPDNPLRILKPRVRDGDTWREAEWDEVLDRIAAAIRDAGGERTVVYRGHGNSSNGVGGPLANRFANLAGTQYWEPSILCWGLGGLGAWLTGITETNTLVDLAEHAELIVLWGANVASQPLTGPALVAAKRRGARVVAIDVRRTEAFGQAEEGYIVRPGSDAALALAMAHVIVNEGLYDAGFVAEHVVGFDEFVTHVKQFTPGWAAGETGLETDEIIALARRWAAAKRGTILLGGSSMHKSGNGWQAARAITCLPALTGSVGRPGAGMGPRHAAQAHGMKLNPAVTGTATPQSRQISEMDTILRSLDRGDIDVMLLLGTNILSSFADSTRVARALSRMKLVVAFDLFENETIRERADIVLPGTTWLEETGFKPTAHFLHLMPQAISRRGDARPVAEILNGLATRLGIDDFFPWASTEAMLDSTFDTDATGHATVAKLRESGGNLPLNTSPVAHPTLTFPTPSGHIELASDRAAELGLPRLPVSGATSESASTEFPLRLTTGRTIGHFHGFYDHGQALPTLAKREPNPLLWIHPDDAAYRSLGDGAPITITSVRGTMNAAAHVTDRVPRGVVWMRDGWTGLNTLTSGNQVVPDAAASVFPSGQASYEAAVQVTRRPADSAD